MEEFLSSFASKSASFGFFPVDGLELFSSKAADFPSTTKPSVEVLLPLDSSNSFTSAEDVSFPVFPSETSLLSDADGVFEESGLESPLSADL